MDNADRYTVLIYVRGAGSAQISETDITIALYRYFERKTFEVKFINCLKELKEYVKTREIEIYCQCKKSIIDKSYERFGIKKFCKTCGKIIRQKEDKKLRGNKCLT